jgi:CubicO group peptidase (beta-lactamase class C family)
LVTNSDVYEWYKKQDGLNFAVGEKFEYSNGGYSLLALLITEASGQSLPEFSREHIFIPAGHSLTMSISIPAMRCRAKMAFIPHSTIWSAGLTRWKTIPL